MCKLLPLKNLFFIFLLVVTTSEVYSQNHDNTESVFLLSNLESLAPDAIEFQTLQSILDQEKAPFTILVNGDFVDKNGMGSTPTDEDLRKVDRIIELAKNNGKIIFIPGDREWDNGGKKGLKKVRALEDYLESKLTKGQTLLPQKGCLGPEVIDVGERTRIVAINSQWFQQEKRPEEEDTDCPILNEKEFWDELGDAFSDADNRNIVVASHHPALSYGHYAGYKLTKQHFLPPIFGSFIAAFHQNIGDQNDLHNPNLKRFATEMTKIAGRHGGLIFVSGHEYDVQLLLKDHNYYINSGALAKSYPVGRGEETLFRSKKTSFTQLRFHENGEVSMHVLEISKKKSPEVLFDKTLFSSPCDSPIKGNIPNSLFNPCVATVDASKTSRPVSSSVPNGPGPQYKAGPIKKMVLGQHYRSTWSTTVDDIPVLNFDSLDGGLRAYAKGGGAQTISLKMKSAEGTKYVFRLIDKNPTSYKDKDLVAGVYGKIVKDLTSSQHPYGSLIVGSLMDEIDLPHSSPKLYIMPDSPQLGPFREEFAGKFGLLEFKPSGKKKKRKGFRGAKKVVSTHQMYQKILDDSDHSLDVDAFVKARIFDMWISDWDRHHNNWKWLAFKEDKSTVYQPFPKDRDKALAALDGIYNILDWEFVAHDMADFRKDYKGLKSLNFKNRNMDRWLANSYTHEDWKKAAQYIQNSMTDEIIRKAIRQVPSEVQTYSSDRLFETLSIRRDKLVAAIEKYYGLLAKYVDLVGSNSRELFELTRLENGDVEAKIYDTNKKGEKEKLLYNRLIKRSETKEIRLHGLGKKDHFLIKGKSKKSILIRIIGGDGKDVIDDQSEVKGSRKMTKVYDYHDKDQLTLNTEAKKIKTPNPLIFESENFFNYDYYVVLPTLSYNVDDGLSIGFAGNVIKQGFNKPDFSQKFNFQGSVTTKRNYNFQLDARFRHVVDRWDLITGINLASRDRSFRRFYGYGNKSILDQDLNDQGFYENETSTLISYLGLSRTFWTKSSFNVSLLFDYRNVRPVSDRASEPSIYNQLPLNEGLDKTTLLGPQVEIDLDFRDSGVFPTRGMQLRVRNNTFFNSELNWKLGGRIESEVSAFFTKGVRIPVTLALRGGLSSSYGGTPFYYKNYLGQQANHRGFVRNRFGGDQAAFLNTDLRFHLGTWINALIPLKFGIYGIYDVGRVWDASTPDSDRLHSAYGGGFYVIPYTESFNLNFTLVQSDRERMLFSFRLGFFVR